MVKTATVSDFQAAMAAETEASELTVAEQLQALNVQSQCDAGMSISQIRGMVLKAADDDAQIAHHDDISIEAERIWATFGYQRSLQADDVTATLTVNGRSAELGSAEAVEIIETAIIEAHAELPGMPPRKSVLRVPAASEFGEDDDYFVSSALANRAKILTDRHPDLFDHLDRLSVTYLWRKEGGKSKGLAVFGKCTKPSGLLKLFSESNFVIWLAADHCRDSYYGDAEIEQTLFHEMLHTGVSEPDENTGRGGGPQMQPHQLEIFHAEIETYGLDAVILREAAPLFRQAVYDSPETAKSAKNLEVGYHDEDDDPETGTGAGVIIHPDGTAYTDDEIEAMERHDLEDDDMPLIDADLAEAAGDNDPTYDGLPDDADHDL